MQCRSWRTFLGVLRRSVPVQGLADKGLARGPCLRTLQSRTAPEHWRPLCLVTLRRCTVARAPQALTLVYWPPTPLPGAAAARLLQPRLVSHVV